MSSSVAELEVKDELDLVGGVEGRSTEMEGVLWWREVLSNTVRYRHGGKAGSGSWRVLTVIKKFYTEIECHKVLNPPDKLRCGKFSKKSNWTILKNFSFSSILIFKASQST